MNKELEKFEELKKEKKTLEARLEEICSQIFEISDEAEIPGHKTWYNYKFKALFDISGTEEGEFSVLARSKEEALKKLDEKEDFDSIKLNIDFRDEIPNTVKLIDREYAFEEPSESHKQKQEKIADYLEKE